MASNTIILVASASAKTGSKVVKFLSETGSVDVRALVRNPDSDAAKALAALPNVTVVKGDFDDASSLVPVLAGVTRAFLVSAPGEDTQYDREVGAQLYCDACRACMHALLGPAGSHEPMCSSCHVDPSSSLALK